MPYEVVKRGEKWLTINSETQDVKGTHDTKEEALRQMRLLYHVKGMVIRTRRLISRTMMTGMKQEIN